MRALIYQLGALIALPAALYAPHVGLLLYYWLSLMSPHSIAWGGLPLPWIPMAVVATIVGLVLSHDRQSPFSSTTIVLLILLWVWTLITTLLAHHPEAAWQHWIAWSKIVLMTVVAVCLINNQLKLQAFVWILVLSIGFYSIKGGLFVLASGGNYLVIGPSASALSGNNEIARAFIMTLPLMIFLALHSAKRLTRLALWAGSGLTVLALVGTSSRGAFVAFLAMIVVAWLRSQYKLQALLVSAVVIAAGFYVLPEERLASTRDRYATIEDYSEDNSFQGRVAVWNEALKIVKNNPITGGGFNVFDLSLGKASHNSYIEAAGEHGIVGFVLYILIVLSVIVHLSRVVKVCRYDPQLFWARDLARLMQLSFVGYLVGSLVINHAFFEYFYVQVGLVAILHMLVVKKITVPNRNLDGIVAQNNPSGKAA
jgi:probable O-glycosylation ligase (exosortase A-associated)